MRSADDAYTLLACNVAAADDDGDDDDDDDDGDDDDGDGDGDDHVFPDGFPAMMTFLMIECSLDSFLSHGSSWPIARQVKWRL